MDDRTSCEQDEDEALENRLQQIKHAIELNRQLIEEYSLERHQLKARLDELCLLGHLQGPSSSNNLLASSTTSETTAKPLRKLTLNAFARPYIRDSKGFTADYPYVGSMPTSFYLMILNQQSSKEWTEEEEKCLLDEVSSQYRHHRSESLVRQLDAAIAQHSSLPENSKEKEMKTKEIKDLNERLALHRTDEVAPERWSNNSSIDWLKVARYIETDRDSSECELYYNNYLHPAVNTTPWTEEEDDQLKTIVDSYDSLQGIWDEVATRLATGRIAAQCFQRHQTRWSTHQVGRIEGEEAKRIETIIKENTSANNIVNWTAVGSMVEHRSLSQIQHFWRTRRRRVETPLGQPWTPLEDRILAVGIQLFGPGNYKAVEHFLPLRNNNQIRQRFINNLSFAYGRKFGDWSGPEDELLLEMAAKCVRKYRGVQLINFPEIQRTYFPNRAKSQLYKRYKLLKRMLPPRVIENPADLSNMATITTTTRKIHSRRFNPRHLEMKSLKTNQEKEKYLMNTLKKLKERHCSDMQNIRKKAATKVKRKRAGKSTEADEWPQLGEMGTAYEELIDEQKIEQLNYFLGTMNVLYSFNLRWKFTRCTRLDQMANLMLELVLLELLDTSAEADQRLPLDHEALDSLPDSKRSKVIDKAHTLQLNLDIVRFFMVSNELIFTSKELEHQCLAPRSLVTPNFFTVFGFAILQLLSEPLIDRISLMCSPSDAGRPRRARRREDYDDEDEEDYLDPFEVDRDDEEEEETAAAFQQHQPNRIDPMAEKAKISQESEFEELSAIFQSIFLWPALLDLYKQEPELKEALKVPSNPSEQGAPPNDVAKVVVAKKRGRPKKKQFHRQVQDFVRERSLQNQIFLTQPMDEVLDSLEQMFHRLPRHGRFWLDEEPVQLVDRVEATLDSIQETVDAHFDKQQAEQEETKQKQKKTDTNKLSRGKKSKCEDKVIELSSEPVRRSQRKL